MVVPVVYRKAPPFSFSFDWVDTVAGCGYKRYYCACSILSTGRTYFLTPNVLDSSKEYTATGRFTEFTTGSPADLDFDIEFKKAARVGGGDAYFNCGVEICSTCTTAVVVTLNHVRGAVETSIGTAQSGSSAGGGGTRYLRECIKIAITETAFAVGDILRITVYATNSSASSSNLHHDPTSNVIIGTDIRTDMVIDIPFKMTI